MCNKTPVVDAEAPVWGPKGHPTTREKQDFDTWVEEHRVCRKPLTPLQQLKRDFVVSYDFERHKRGCLRDAISYAQALKSGGWRITVRGKPTPQDKDEALGVLRRWTKRHTKSVRLTVPVLRQVINFVYDNREL